MNIRSFKAPRQRIFRSCIPGKFIRTDDWISVDKLINSVSSQYTPTTPKVILDVARSGLKLQIFDSKLWALICSNTLAVRELYTPNQWVELLHIYKRIKTRNPELFNAAAVQLGGRLNALSLRDLSILTLSFSYFTFCPNGLFENVAEIVCARCDNSLISANNEISSEITRNSVGLVDAESVENKCRLKNNELSAITSYVHLLGSYAKCGFEHKQLFEVVAESILNKLSKNNAIIPPNILLKLLTAYSR
ncbi:hypothetical protein BEWA_009760 [Theileria equi strain WA]|uniref:Uncharacterized protein n=1 Tax=Theileria equi strain WA TaxID=1537102 RepID=L0B121_THEEQ|nr:hypothetical protein BEWA_009760 [Theileria equi strain WA]AFZ81562.1 hypothetical protein BEWA_009760 [Theileria equi strain WA]|eukprot:XP_004831228.1 hypothetical protein BEWA_009760 [Theileria equi strain WA]